jgi:mannose-6-phosphate isomerase-like protein (cupin superfamily)
VPGTCLALRGGLTPAPAARDNDDLSRFVVTETATVGGGERVVFSRANGCERLEQRLIRFGPGRSGPRSPGEHQEILYVTAGSGLLVLDGKEHPLEPDSGVLVLPGEAYEVEVEGEGELEVVSVVAPAAGEVERERVVSRFADREEGRADEKRTFRVLHQGELTQFIGVVEPCRAPDHSHPYDEVGYIVEGHGLAHVGGESTPIGPGSCFHLPPQEVHCIENTGPGVMRIMGVFFPAGSPRQRSYDAAGT